MKRRAEARRADERRCGRYELLHPLGAGGMAEVFKARVTGSAGFRRDVVLKRLHAANNDDPEFVSMFTDEARILGVLHHPNVVQALDFGRENDKLFLVLEYVEGPSLARVLRHRRPVPAGIVAFVGRELCRALDYMHHFADADGTPLGLVHRDVTPSNIILTPAGAVKLLDFGIAKFAKATQATQNGVVKGKSGYLSPEQLRGEAGIDGRVDLFALGAVLHELLTGERLFAGDTDLGTMKKILEMKIPLPSRLRAEVPPALDRAVMRALERIPAKRYGSAWEMARDLDAVVL
ncbi:MAG TPA: serine/threonine-protein kinase, partial [Polyangia bacterium]|nr:serine/threonine-protein kinase [Polyangia bacterium]